MDIDLIQATQTLPRGGTSRVAERPKARLMVVRGRLWLTRNSDPQDYVLGAGDSFRLDRADKLIATALEDSAFAVLDQGVDGAAPTSARIEPGALERYRMRAEQLRSRYLSELVGIFLDRSFGWAAKWLRGWVRGRPTGGRR